MTPDLLTPLSGARGLYALPQGTAPLEAVASRLLALADPADPLDLARGFVLLPNLRAARALQAAFLDQAGGRALLPPRMLSLSEAGEEALALTGALDLPPALPPLRRQAQLARLVARYDSSLPPERAFRLAGELGSLLDELHRWDADPSRLPGLVDDPRFAEHWHETARFLSIVTEAWPAHLAEQQALDPTDRSLRLQRALARAWTDAPPRGRVTAIAPVLCPPATIELLRIIARLDRGSVLLPGLDLQLPEDAWDAVAESHPMAGPKRLLAALGVTRADLSLWPGRPSRLVSRARVLSLALRPAEALGGWAREPIALSDLDGLSRIDCDSPQVEALAIALLLRDAIEVPGARAALVTPDRQIAARVVAELGRFGLRADDSAGEPLGRSAGGAFLRAILRVHDERFAPVPLLALLKHPLAAGGWSRGSFRATSRSLELALLRGPRPEPGLNGLRRALDLHLRERAARGGSAEPRPADERIRDLLDLIATTLGPLDALWNRPRAAPSQLLDSLLQAALSLAARSDGPGEDWLHAGEEGEAMALHLAECSQALEGMEPISPSAFPGLFDALLEAGVARANRGTRGRAEAPHPRIAIQGLIEARLQSFDLVVLAGLNEGTWPGLPDPGPWLSRPMRTDLGLPAPESMVGLAGHDFVSLATSAPRAVLVRARRVDGTPTVPARWLTRLEALLEGRLGAEAARLSPARDPAGFDWGGIARAIDRDAERRPDARPAPCPPVAARPRSLSVTEVETWIKDPYAIHARHVLGLQPLDPIDAQEDQRRFGQIVHAVLERFTRAVAAHGWPADPYEAIGREADAVFLEFPSRAGIVALWRPRIERLSRWFVEHEGEALREASVLLTEQRGVAEFPGPAGSFRLRARADRIDLLPDHGAALVDYKTGALPSLTDVQKGFSPQLPLEALLVERGGFEAARGAQVVAMRYLRVTGASVPAEARDACKGDVRGAIDTAAAGFARLVARYDDPAQPYHPRLFPAKADRYARYDHLSRIASWSAPGAEEP